MSTTRRKNLDSLDEATWVWIPGAEPASIPGRIVSRSGGASKLFLNGSFSDGAEGGGTHDLLWGYLSTSADRITFVRSLFMRNHGVNTHRGTESMVKWVLLGEHIGADALLVDACEIEWEGGNEWFDKTFLPVGIWWEGKPIDTPRVERVQEKFPVPSLNASFEIVLNATTRPRREKTVMRQSFVWGLEFLASTTIEDAHDAIRALRDFVWLVVGVRVRAKRIRLRTTAAKWVTLGGSQHYERARRKSSPPLHAQWMCLPHSSFNESTPRFNEVLNAWLRLRVDEKENSFSHWAAIIDPHGAVEPNLASAVQFFDSILPGTTKMAEDTFERIILPLLEAQALPFDLKEEIASSMAWGIRNANSGSLKERMLVALRRLPGEVITNFSLDPKLVRDSVDARNKLAHAGHRGMKLEQAVMVHARTRLFALVYVLQLIGIPDDLIERRIKNVTAWHPPVFVGIL